MKSRIVSCVVLFALAILATPRLHAFCLEPKIRVDDEFFVSDVVFTGTLIEDQKLVLTSDGHYVLTSEGYYDEEAYTWRVQRVFRGVIHPGDMVRTYSANDSGRFAYDTEVGQHFLIFANPDPTHKGGFVADSCGNSAPLSKATPTIAEIRQLPTRHGGLLYGKMIDGDVGVRITAIGAGGKYSAITGPDATFSIRVPPGTYAVTATKQGHTYVDFDLAYKHSKAAAVPDGGSAGLAYREQGR